MTDIRNTLKGRGTEYGEFQLQADLAQTLKDIMRQTPGWSRLTNDKRESLEMIQHKIARILNGNPNIKDSWADIAGYAILIEDSLYEANHSVSG